ncbi:helix-hairpin-helix domain-containing protein [Halobacillus sp. K22]|uniref:helix-hairpin-helix domain-containing protein n=1 Tax=Halobacillus sp. K22 TaxID=3457431 RepID=UPI003FCE5A4A
MSFLRRYTWIILVVVVAMLIILFNNPAKEKNTVTVEKSEKVFDKGLESDPSEIIVDVKGEVVKPGVYTVKPGLRVDGVIQMAGGLTTDADPSSVNLAQKLQDEMVISVLSLPSVSNETVSSETNDLLAINQATLEEIQSLNGIGPSKAAAILQYREENGPFKTSKDLLNVSGIGEKTLENMEEYIRIP